MKRSIIAVAFFLTLFHIYGQSSNYRAQGKYYSALTSLKNKDYSSSITYILQCKEFLGGKSNIEVEYVHILAAWNSHDYISAQREVVRFFDLVEGREKQESFDKTVDRLTPDEIKEITKLLDPINEAVEVTQKKETEKKEAQRIATIRAPYEVALRKMNAVDMYRAISFGDIGTITFSFLSWDGDFLADSIGFTLPKCIGRYDYQTSDDLIEHNKGRFTMYVVFSLTIPSTYCPFSSIKDIVIEDVSYDKDVKRIHFILNKPFKMQSKLFAERKLYGYKNNSTTARWYPLEEIGYQTTKKTSYIDENELFIDVASDDARSIVDALKILMKGPPQI